LTSTGVTAFAMELLPRISRAQAMDVLSSQANIAGYKAVLVAAYHYGRFMPMLMTAAGTVKAARVLILGPGLAGLQAVALAQRPRDARGRAAARRHRQAPGRRD